MAEHGIAGFVEDSDDDTRAPVTRRGRRCKAIWNILDEQGLASGVIGWWASYPAEPIHGFVVTDYFGFHSFALSGESMGVASQKVHPPEILGVVEKARVRPASVSATVLRSVLPVDEATAKRLIDHPTQFIERQSHLVQVIATAQTYAAVAHELLQNRPVDLFAIYFEGTDNVCHLFERYSPPRLNGVKTADYDAWNSVVGNYYAFQDAILGQLLTELGSETDVLVVSDHGFAVGADRPTFLHANDIDFAHTWHRERGIFVACGPSFRHGTTIDGATILDIAPTLLFDLGLAVPLDLAGHVLRGAFTDEALKRLPARTVATYEATNRSSTMAVPPSPPADAAGAADSEIRRMNEQRLRALGYLGGDK